MVLLNDREVMVEFEGAVPIEILNEQVSMLRKWIGISEVSVQCCWPMSAAKPGLHKQEGF